MVDEAPAVPRPRFPLGFNLVTLRAFLTNFDIGLLLLVAVPFMAPGWP